MANLGSKSVSLVLWLLLIAIVALCILGVINLIQVESEVPDNTIQPNDTVDTVERLPCTRDNQWLPKNAVVYLPNLLDPRRYGNFTSMDLKAVLISRRFHTVITDCPSKMQLNDTTGELAILLGLNKYKAEIQRMFFSTFHFWLLQTPDESLSTCLELANAANQKQYGSIRGVVLRDDVLLTFAEVMKVAAPYFQAPILLSYEHSVWKLVANTTMLDAKRYTLETGLMISSMYCYELENQIPDSLMANFSRKFFLEGNPKTVVNNGIPVLTLSEEYKGCKKYLSKDFDLEMVLPYEVTVKGVHLKPYCLL